MCIVLYFYFFVSRFSFQRVYINILAIILNKNFKIEIERIKDAEARLQARDENNVPVPPAYTVNPVMVSILKTTILYIRFYYILLYYITLYCIILYYIVKYIIIHIIIYYIILHITQNSISASKAVHTDDLCDKTSNILSHPNNNHADETSTIPTDRYDGNTDIIIVIIIVMIIMIIIMI